ncbi:MAG: VOC family protein [Blastomonas fulva]|uniref:VOC family protein n=1 Tax=Blastomonas fulva TaxID=1550728 RepID=UPI0024E219F1|nr:VOC family protein [Blastomonas fulva]MDK2756030.1 VOC family protein [Blastomonas fulva]
MTELYASVGSNDIQAAMAFYDELLPTIGLNTLLDNPDGGRFYGRPGGAMLAVVPPFDKRPATVGNGSMTGFFLDSPAAVDAFHAKVLALGGSCDGPPGYRGPEAAGAYFAYARDLDGNKLCAYNWTLG